MPRSKKSFDLAQGASLGLTLGAVLSLFTYLGYRLDQWLGTAPFGLLVGCTLGLGGGLYHVVRKVADIGREEPPSENGRDERP